MTEGQRSVRQLVDPRRVQALAEDAERREKLSGSKRDVIIEDVGGVCVFKLDLGRTFAVFGFQPELNLGFKEQTIAQLPQDYWGYDGCERRI